MHTAELAYAMKKSSIASFNLPKTLSFRTIALSLLLLFLAITHVIYLSVFPPGLSHDEIEYSLSAKTFSMRGVDLSGYGLPLAFFKTETEGNISILPVMLLSPFHLFLPLSQVTARLPYVLLNFATAVVLFYLVIQLFQNRKIAAIAAILFLINPWSFYLSHYSTESPFALFFYLAAILAFLRFRGRMLLIPLLLLICGFFSYHGAKLLFIPLVFVIVLYLLYQKSHKKQPFTKTHAGLVLAIGIGVFAAFYLIGSAIPESIITRRSEELLLLNPEKITKLVNDQRQATINSPLLPYFVNKYSITTTYLLEKYFGAFSPTVLFFHGDTRLIYQFFHHGLFYPIDFIFILLGIAVLSRVNKNASLFLGGLALIAPIPSMLNDVETSYVHRSFLLLPVLIIFAAGGLYAIYSWLSEKIRTIPAIALLSLCMLLFYSSFLVFYFYRYPVAHGEFYGINDRLLAKFVQDTRNDNMPIHTAVVEPRHAYLSWLYYTNDTQLLRAHLDHVKDFNAGRYKLPLFTATRDCPLINDKKTSYIIENTLTCFQTFIPTYTINNPKDAGTMYKIYNSKICQGANMVSWKRFHTSDDYNIESMPPQVFCSHWIAPVGI
jgi:4-amino-4-deoxy-L-arabinose transferase-like glycosyltransferase